MKPGLKFSRTLSGEWFWRVTDARGNLIGHSFRTFRTRELADQNVMDVCTALKDGYGQLFQNPVNG